MSGEDLYDLWRAANAMHDCEVDENWDQLSDFDRAIWTSLAESLP